MIKMNLFLTLDEYQTVREMLRRPTNFYRYEIGYGVDSDTRTGCYIRLTNCELADKLPERTEGTSNLNTADAVVVPVMQVTLEIQTKVNDKPVSVHQIAEILETLGLSPE